MQDWSFFALRNAKLRVLISLSDLLNRSLALKSLHTPFSIDQVHYNITAFGNHVVFVNVVNCA